MRCSTFLVLTVSACLMATLAWLSQRDGESKTLTTSPSNSSAESQKPGAPMSGMSAIFDRDRRTKTASTLAERLAENPHAALEWLLQTSGRDQNSSLSTDTHLQSAVIDAANRLMRATRSETGQDNPVPAALGNFVQLWSAVDLRSAYQWVYQIPAGHVRNALMVRVAFVGAEIVPSEAASLVVEELPPGAIQDEAIMMVLHQWALQDPDSAAAWVNLFPDDQFRDRASNELQGIVDYHRASLAAP